eukprot:14337753-Ditylum_brightwellii.AAC.1
MSMQVLGVFLAKVKGIIVKKSPRWYTYQMDNDSASLISVSSNEEDNSSSDSSGGSRSLSNSND